MFLRKFWIPIAVFLVVICGLSFYLLRSDVPKEPIKIYKTTTPLPKQMDIRDKTLSTLEPVAQVGSTSITEARTSEIPGINTSPMDLSQPFGEDGNLRADLEVVPDEPNEDLPVSPFGFGPYPEVPADYFGEPIWTRNPNTIAGFPDHALENIELIDRVLIKLWEQGDRKIVGGSTAYGKVYPHYRDIIYVRWTETPPLSDGTVHSYISRAKGANNGYSIDDIETGNIPWHFTVIDFDDAGYDPYEFLNLQHLDNY